MVFAGLVTIFKPVVMVWAGLNAIDDLTTLFRVSRLAAVLLPGGDKTDMCQVCDDVMGDLLSGTDGLDALPCKYACLGIRGCIDMCEAVKATAANATSFPCVAAGYCEADEADDDLDSVECRAVPILRCEPARYCKRTRVGLRMKCQLKPGIGRWVGMRNAVEQHASALADGLLKQPHCGEPNAGPYCIAAPKGFGVLAEVVGHILSLFYGGLRTIISIETPGGDDDRQWLTFWLILTMLLFCERFFARVLLSTLPLYYEGKLALLCWLMFRDGGETVYRKLRRLLVEHLGNLVIKGDDHAHQTILDVLRLEYDDLIQAALVAESLRRERHRGGNLSPSKPHNTQDWEEERTKFNCSQISDTNCTSASDQLFAFYQFVLSREGNEMLSKLNQTDSQKAILLQRASSEVSFQPRFVQVHLIGTADKPFSRLKAMDSNGSADAYAVLRLVSPDGYAYPSHGVYSRAIYRTLHPQWNQWLELKLLGGKLDPDGMFRHPEGSVGTLLNVQVYDADVGIWGWVLYASELAGLVVAVLGVVAWVTGRLDSLSDFHTRVAAGFTAALFALLVLAYTGHSSFHMDDSLIGEASMPLDMLMDRQTHSVVLTLRGPKEVSPEPASPQHFLRRPGMRSTGRIRLDLRCSER